jgi:hypothetical protein
LVNAGSEISGIDSEPFISHDRFSKTGNIPKGTFCLAFDATVIGSCVSAEFLSRIRRSGMLLPWSRRKIEVPSAPQLTRTCCNQNTLLQPALLHTSIRD